MFSVALTLNAKNKSGNLKFKFNLCSSSRLRHVINKLKLRRFERRASTGNGLFIFGQWFCPSFRQIYSIRVNTGSNTKLVASRYIKRGKALLTVDSRHSKKSLLQLRYHWVISKTAREVGIIFFCFVLFLSGAPRARFSRAWAEPHSLVNLPIPENLVIT